VEGEENRGLRGKGGEKGPIPCKDVCYAGRLKGEGKKVKTDGVSDSVECLAGVRRRDQRNEAKKIEDEEGGVSNGR